MKEKKNMGIGVLDSGLGGLTVVRELGLLLPGEKLFYYGDNGNCPYGNRTKEDILNLTIIMLDFLKEQGIKVAAIACNTISTLIEELRARYDFPIISIIEAATAYTASLEVSDIGVFATEFTVKQGHYERLIKELSEGKSVFSISSRDLAMLVDEGRFDNSLLIAEVKALVAGLRQKAPQIRHVVLGCTHYPIVQDLFQQEAPEFTFINPALAQAEAVKAMLSKEDLLSNGEEAHLDIFTSGEKQQYEPALKKLKIERPMTFHTRNKKG